MTDSPFVPGARIAILGGPYPREATVNTVRKGGNFTIVGEGPQQWRPWQNSRGSQASWRASKTGQNTWSSRESVIFWDASTEPEILQELGKAKRFKRLRSIQDRLARLNADNVADGTLTQLEAVLDIHDKLSKGAE